MRGVSDRLYDLHEPFPIRSCLVSRLTAYRNIECSVGAIGEGGRGYTYRGWILHCDSDEVWTTIVFATYCISIDFVLNGRKVIM